MNLFDRISRYRYEYPNQYSSVKFIDYMITDLNESVIFEIPKELKKISHIIRNVFRYSRYEPTNPYVFHKRVPAARNVHTNEAYLVCDGNICRYNCKIDVFECIGYCQEEHGNVRLIVVAELWRIMKFYGEFGLVLPLLDAGHILAQLKIDLETAGLTEADILYGARELEEYRRLGLSLRSNLITLEINLEKLVNYQAEIMIDKTYFRTMNYDAEVSSYEVAEQLLSHEQGFHMRKMLYDSKCLKPFMKMQKRESAHNYIGICSIVESIDEEIVNEYIGQLAAYMNHYIEDVDRYKVYTLYTTEAGQYMTPIERGKIGSVKRIDVDKSQLLHDTASMIDMESMPVTVYISYLYDEELSEVENIYNAHIGAAELAHYFLLNGSKDGYFGRPMRNLEDVYLETILPIDRNERFMYSLIMGKANSLNYVYYL